MRLDKSTRKADLVGHRAVEPYTRKIAGQRFQLLNQKEGWLTFDAPRS